LQMDFISCSAPFDTRKFGVGKEREARPDLVGADPRVRPWLALGWGSGQARGPAPTLDRRSAQPGHLGVRKVLKTYWDAERLAELSEYPTCKKVSPANYPS